MGESAGAGSIEYHVTSRDTALSRRSLFQRAVMQSPFFFPDPGRVQNHVAYQPFWAQLELHLSGELKLLPLKH